MPRAYSYLRFSSAAQATGDSFRRQTEGARTYAARRGLKPDDELTFHDLGVSAFRGKNAEVGALGAFLEAVREGLVEPGSVLLVESLDRISRQHARKALRVLEEIVDEDVEVVTLSDGRSYTKQTLDTDPTALIMSILIFIRAGEESRTKSMRASAAWSARKQRAAKDGKPITARIPGWLRIREDGSGFEIVEERAAIVRRIFDAYLSGQRAAAIARDLNRDGVETFRYAALWGRATVFEILKSQTVLGTYVPHRWTERDGKRERVAETPIEGYYPQIIDQETFDKTQDILSGSAKVRDWSATPRLLADLATCPKCGGAMRYRRSSRKYHYLVCRAADQGDPTCEPIYVRAAEPERPIRDDVETFIASAPAGRDAGLDADIRSLEDDIAGAEDVLDNLIDAQGRGWSQAVADRIAAIEKELPALRGRLDDLYGFREKTSGRVVRKRLDDLRAAIGAGDTLAANTALRALCDRIVVDYDAGQIVAHWSHGGEVRYQYGFPDLPTAKRGPGRPPKRRAPKGVDA